MAETIKSVFTDEARDVKIDNRLIRSIDNYTKGWANATEERIAFLGSNLIGVHAIRFKDSDRNLWFDEVLELDDFSLRQKLHSLPSVNPKFKVSSDDFNLTCMWLLHAIHNAPSLSEAQKTSGKINVLLTLHYKFISSLMAYYFPHPADQSVAVATYAALSRKFAIKRHGSWGALLQARSEDIIAKNSIHYNTIQSFDKDKDIIYMVNDIQGRIREVVKEIVAVFYQVREQDSKILVTSAGAIDLDGEAVVRDKRRNQVIYQRYIHEIISDRRTFIKDELVGVITKAMHTMSERHLMEALDYLVVNKGASGERDIDPMLDGLLVHAFDYLGANKNSFASLDLATVLKRLRSVYMASRSNDPDLIRVKKHADRIVKYAVNTRSSSARASARTGMMLYIVLRTFAKNHYSQ